MSAYSKDVIREIYKTKSRFFTLIVIAFLTSLTYVGLNSTVSDVKKNVNNIINSNNMYDIRIDAMGFFTEKDINLLKSIPEIEKIVFYNETVDFNKKILYIENEKLTGKNASSLINFNNANLLENYTITSKSFDLSYPQTTIIKSGIKMEKAFFIPKSPEKEKNVAIIHLKKKNKDTFSKEYIDYLQKIKDKINTLLINRPYERKNEIHKNISKGLNEIQEGLIKIENNKENLLKNKKKIIENENELLQKKKTFLTADSNFQKGFNKIEKHLEKVNSENEKLIIAKENIINGLKKINQSFSKVESGLKTIKAEEEKLIENEKKLNDNVKFLSEDKIDLYRKKIEDAKNKLSTEKKKLQDVVNKKQELEKNKINIENGLNKINEAKVILLKNKQELLEKQEKYNNEYNKNYSKLKEAENNLKIAKNEIQKGNQRINETKLNLEKKQGQLEIQKKFLVTPAYVIGSRYDNQAFLTLYNNINSTKIMCYLFPTCFFIIGLFISTTTIIRFAEEQRKITGAYKFLGYSPYNIIIKYLCYGIIPTIIGLIFGCVCGTYLLPKIIVPTLVVDFISIFKCVNQYYVPIYTVTIFTIFILTIIITILIIAFKQINENVVSLLTGYSVSVGKRILLEKTFIWKKLNFSKKILFRNIFKYKTRMFMTIFGIGGCTALIYLGIALHYAISDITKFQYNHVKKYDAIVYFKYDVDDIKKNEYIDKIKKIADIYTLNIQQVKYNYLGLDYHLTHEYLINGNDDKFFNFKLKQNETAISKKTAKILHLKKGKNILLINIYNRQYSMKVNNIFENYISQYVYTKDNTKKVNALLVKYKNNNFVNSTIALENDIVFNVQTKHDNKIFFEKQIHSLSNVIVLMIFLGASLSIIVTYNLGNINILERKRELSTLKVLGYKKTEMYLYIFREIILLAIISILFGLFLGRKFQLFLASQFKTSPIQLVVILNYKPFLISAFLSIIVVLIVCILLIPKINKINMIEALKASE